MFTAWTASAQVLGGWLSTRFGGKWVFGIGALSRRRRGRHSADTPSPSLPKRLLTGEGGAAK